MNYGVFLRNGQVDITGMNSYEDSHEYTGFCLKEFWMEDGDVSGLKDVLLYAQGVALHSKLPMSDYALIDFARMVEQ